MMYVNNTLWFCVAVSFFFFVSETSGKQELVKWKLWVGSIVHRLARSWFGIGKSLGTKQIPLYCACVVDKLRSVGHFAVLKLVSCGESGAGCSPCEP